MKPHYYLMSGKKILRLEEEQSFSDLSPFFQSLIIDSGAPSMNQDEANWRVAIFRDEIMELDEFESWVNGPEFQEDCSFAS